MILHVKLENLSDDKELKRLKVKLLQIEQQLKKEFKVSKIEISDSYSLDTYTINKQTIRELTEPNYEKKKKII